jgi:hypothetical protein
VEALARLRPLAILDETIRGEKGQPSDADLRRLGKELLRGRRWGDVFQGVASVEIGPDGAGPGLSLRLTKKEGIPIHLVAEGTPGASVVAVMRVDELSYYSLGARQLAEKVELTMPKLIAVVDHLGLRGKPDVYKSSGRRFGPARSSFNWSPRPTASIWPSSNRRREATRRLGLGAT